MASLPLWWNGHSFLDCPVGFGGYFNRQWFQGRWLPHMSINRDKGISIEWQELFPIVVAYALWHPHFAGKCIQFWCDNESVVAVINSGHSKAPRVVDLLWFLVLVSMRHNFFVQAHHVPGVSNNIADALSHFQIENFWPATRPIGTLAPSSLH